MMSDVTDQYVARAKRLAVAQYASVKSALERPWPLVSQTKFHSSNLAYFKVPQAGIETIRSKLALKVLDENANILKGMFSTRFNGRASNSDAQTQVLSSPSVTMPPSSTPSNPDSLITLGASRRRRRG